MGLFSKKPKKNKMYTLQEAMSFVRKQEGYSVIPEEGGYKVVPDEIANEGIKKHKLNMSARQVFKDRISTGFTPTRNLENSNYGHRYGYHDEER